MSSSLTLTVETPPNAAHMRVFIVEGRQASLPEKQAFIFKEQGAACAQGFYSFLADQLLLPKVEEVRMFAVNGRDYVAVSMKDKDASVWDTPLSSAPGKIVFSNPAASQVAQTSGNSYLSHIEKRIKSYVAAGKQFIGQASDYHKTPEFLKELNDYAQKNMPAIVRRDGGDISIIGFDAEKGVLKAAFHGSCATNGCDGGQFTTTLAFRKVMRSGFPNIIRNVAFENDPTGARQHHHDHDAALR